MLRISCLFFFHVRAFFLLTFESAPHIFTLSQRTPTRNNVMDSQEFAQAYPWITWEKAYKIAKEHGLETELACEAHDEVKTRGTIGAIEVNTQSLVDWLGY